MPPPIGRRNQSISSPSTSRTDGPKKNGDAAPAEAPKKNDSTSAGGWQPRPTVNPAPRPPVNEGGAKPPKGGVDEGTSVNVGGGAKPPKGGDNGVAPRPTVNPAPRPKIDET